MAKNGTTKKDTTKGKDVVKKEPEVKVEETKVEETKVEENAQPALDPRVDLNEKPFSIGDVLPKHEPAVEEKKEEETKPEEKKEEVQDTEKVKEELEKAHQSYVKTLEKIRVIVPKDKFKEKENNSGITFFGTEGTRTFKFIETKKGFKIELNVAVSEVDGLTSLTEKEASDKHMGTCRWIYIGDNTATAVKLIDEAIKKFEPKKRSDSKEEKDKKEANKETKPAEKKDEVKKETKPAEKKDNTKKDNAKNGTQKGRNLDKDNQSHAKNGPVITTKLTPEELAKLGSK